MLKKLIFFYIDHCQNFVLGHILIVSLLFNEGNDDFVDFFADFVKNHCFEKVKSHAHQRFVLLEFVDFEKDFLQDKKKNFEVVPLFYQKIEIFLPVVLLFLQEDELSNIGKDEIRE